MIVLTRNNEQRVIAGDRPVAEPRLDVQPRRVGGGGPANRAGEVLHEAGGVAAGQRPLVPRGAPAVPAAVHRPRAEVDGADRGGHAHARLQAGPQPRAEVREAHPSADRRRRRSGHVALTDSGREPDVRLRSAAAVSVVVCGLRSREPGPRRRPRVPVQGPRRSGGGLSKTAREGGECQQNRWVWVREENLSHIREPVSCAGRGCAARPRAAAVVGLPAEAGNRPGLVGCRLPVS